MKMEITVCAEEASEGMLMHYRESLVIRGYTGWMPAQLSQEVSCN